jgi:hypothetical protein
VTARGVQGRGVTSVIATSYHFATTLSKPKLITSSLKQVTANHLLFMAARR